MSRRLLHRPQSILSCSAPCCSSSPYTRTLAAPRSPPSTSWTPAMTTTSIQKRTATLIRRPKRPYQFTQLVTLSDGSTFTQRTTSPAPIHKSIKDVRNSPMWNPSNRRLNTIEEDEAGRLKKFRERFGRGWDADRAEDESDGDGRDGSEGEDGQSHVDLLGKDVDGAATDRTAANRQDETGQKDSLFDLISGYSARRQPARGRTGQGPDQNQAKDKSMNSAQSGKKR